jgi:hypothetical protein
MISNGFLSVAYEWNLLFFGDEISEHGYLGLLFQSVYIS